MKTLADYSLFCDQRNPDQQEQHNCCCQKVFLGKKFEHGCLAFSARKPEGNRK